MSIEYRSRVLVHKFGGNIFKVSQGVLRREIAADTRVAISCLFCLAWRWFLVGEREAHWDIFSNRVLLIIKMALGVGLPLPGNYFTGIPCAEFSSKTKGVALDMYKTVVYVYVYVPYCSL